MRKDATQSPMCAWVAQHSRICNILHDGIKAGVNKASCCEEAETRVTHCNSPARKREGETLPPCADKQEGECTRKSSHINHSDKTLSTKWVTGKRETWHRYEREEDQEAAVQMSSTVIPPCKAVEDEIPLVECALMLPGRGDSQCDRHWADRQTDKSKRLFPVVNKQMLGTSRGSHARHIAGQGTHGVKQMRRGFLLRVVTLDLTDLMMLLGLKAGLGRNTAKLPSPWILRHKEATERADKSLTLFAELQFIMKPRLDKCVNSQPFHLQHCFLSGASQQKHVVQTKQHSLAWSQGITEWQAVVRILYPLEWETQEFPVFQHDGHMEIHVFQVYGSEHILAHVWLPACEIYRFVEQIGDGSHPARLFRDQENNRSKDTDFPLEIAYFIRSSCSSDWRARQSSWDDRTVSRIPLSCRGGEANCSVETLLMSLSIKETRCHSE